MEAILMIRVCILGLGYRSKYFVDAIGMIDDIEIVGALVRDKNTIYEPLKAYNINLTTNKEDIISLKPSFIINTSSKKVNTALSAFFLEKGIPVLQETPIALEDDLIDSMMKYKGLYQIAEQYQYYDYFIKIKEYIEKGYLGDIKSMTFSYAHDYHGISIIRHILGDFKALSITGSSFKENITHTRTRYDEFHDGLVKEYSTKHLFINWDNIKVIYDFNSEEYRSHIRNPYLVIHGSRGEIINDTIRYLDEDNNYKMDTIEGYNSFDDLIPVKRVILKMIDFYKTKEEFYPLEYARDDSKLSIIMNSFDENLKNVNYNK